MCLPLTQGHGTLFKQWVARFSIAGYLKKTDRILPKNSKNIPIIFQQNI